MAEVDFRQYGPIAQRAPFARKISIANLPTIGSSNYDITEFITQASVSYSIDMAAELSFDIIDRDLLFAKNNYFVIGRDVIYETQAVGRIDSGDGTVQFVKQLFEISKVSVSQGPGGSPTFSVQCYTKAIQQMKRDRQPGSVSGNGTAFIKAAAAKYGLRFFGENTAKAKQITKSSGSKQAQSLWDVMQNLASDAKFVLFEVDGVLVFASEKWLMHKWGTNSVVDTKTTVNSKTKKKTTTRKNLRYVNLTFSGIRSRAAVGGNPLAPLINPDEFGRAFELTEYPNITKSDNDPYAGNGSCTVLRVNGTQLRPGMTAYVGGIPNMSDYYLITGVTFNELTGDPVSIEFRSPEKNLEKEKIKDLPIGSTYEQTYITDTQLITPRPPVTSKTISTVLFDKDTGLDRRLIPLPTAEFPYRYPTMPFANLTQQFPRQKSQIIAAVKPAKDSTLENETVVVTGNINLYERPVLAQRLGSSKIITFNTLGVVTVTVESGSEWLTIILPTIWTEGANAVQKTATEVINLFEDSTGYEGLNPGKHLGVVRGTTRTNSIINARDYTFLLDLQQRHILMKRLTKAELADPELNLGGAEDSQWYGGTEV